jgi:pimeloyl-ACP methyl ester carboxylesterase
MSTGSDDTRFVTLPWAGRSTRIEYRWLEPSLPPGGTTPAAPATAADDARPVMVFLHEGLGSVSMWRDFPQRVCEATGLRGLVYSRPGYGASSPRPPNEQWAPDFMHRQAHEVLPALLTALGVDATRQPVWLFGHSDGGSIALLHAARFPAQVAGLVVLAPHILVEDVSVQSIEVARQAYIQTDLRQRLARHHDDPDSAFWGWNRVWLSPEFKSWHITDELRSMAAPVLAVQGLDDEYGTLEQIRGIARVHPTTQLLELAACGHSPHRDQPEALLAAVAAFVTHHRPSHSLT